MIEYIFDIITTVLTLTGVIAIIVWSVDNFSSLVLIIKAILTPYFQPEENQTLQQRYGDWAVITGATDGIGKQYAHELASRKINIVLISRTESKLIQTANEIASKYHVKTKWIAADFSQGQKIYKHIESELQGIPVGILVNNVGRMYDYPDELGKVPEQILWDIININIGSVTAMTRLIVNDMKKRGKGAIVNISSGSELQPLPYATVYSASKIYVKNFTLALRKEVESYGITVQLVTPMFVITKMNEYSTSVMAGSILIPNVKSYTRSAVFTLGKTYKTTGFWSHGVQYALMKLSPEWMRTIIGGQMNLKFRQEYMDQQQEQPKVKSQ